MANVTMVQWTILLFGAGKANTPVLPVISTTFMYCWFEGDLHEAQEIFNLCGNLILFNLSFAPAMQILYQLPTSSIVVFVY